MYAKKILLVSLFLSVNFLSQCTENNSDKNISKETAENNLVDKSICELFSVDEVGKIMGVTFEEATPSIHTVNPDGGGYVSQCGYYTNKGLQHIAVLVRYFKGTTFPQTPEEFISASKIGDAELDAQLDKAMKNHIKVQGVGDAAFFYSLWESNSLVVHWNIDHEMIISMYHFNLDEPTMEKIKLIAKMVMEKFN